MHADLTLANRPDLATERLLLRRPRAGDEEAVVTAVGDWEVARRLARVPHPYGLADARFFLGAIVPAEWVWAVTLRGSDLLVGAAGLTPDANTDAAELGYWLAREHWGAASPPRRRTPLYASAWTSCVCRGSRPATSRRTRRRATCWRSSALPRRAAVRGNA